MACSAQFLITSRRRMKIDGIEISSLLGCDSRTTQNKELTTCPRSEMPINQPSQTVSLSSTVPFLDYLMFYVSDSLSTRPINSRSCAAWKSTKCAACYRVSLRFGRLARLSTHDKSFESAQSLSIVASECYFSLVWYRAPENAARRDELK